MKVIHLDEEFKEKKVYSIPIIYFSEKRGGNINFHDMIKEEPKQEIKFYEWDSLMEFRIKLGKMIGVDHRDFHFLGSNHLFFETYEITDTGLKRIDLEFTKPPSISYNYRTVPNEHANLVKNLPYEISFILKKDALRLIKNVNLYFPIEDPIPEMTGDVVSDFIFKNKTSINNIKIQSYVKKIILSYKDFYPKQLAPIFNQVSLTNHLYRAEIVYNHEGALYKIKKKVRFSPEKKRTEFVKKGVVLFYADEEVEMTFTIYETVNNLIELKTKRRMNIPQIYDKIVEVFSSTEIPYFPKVSKSHEIDKFYKKEKISFNADIPTKILVSKGIEFLKENNYIKEIEGQMYIQKPYTEKIDKNRGDIDNLYYYFTDSKIFNTYKLIYKGRKLNYFPSGIGYSFNIERIGIEEYEYYTLLLKFLAVFSPAVEEEKSIKGVKLLKKSDPLLYGPVKDYARLCQKKNQPVITNDKKDFPYINFSTGETTYYKCPNSNFPVLDFVKGHPEDYCIPCCKKKFPKERRLRERQKCIETGKFENVKEVDKRGYIINYNKKENDRNRVAKLPDNKDIQNFFGGNNFYVLTSGKNDIEELLNDHGIRGNTNVVIVKDKKGFFTVDIEAFFSEDHPFVFIIEDKGVYYIVTKLEKEISFLANKDELEFKYSIKDTPSLNAIKIFEEKNFFFKIKNNFIIEEVYANKERINYIKIYDPSLGHCVIPSGEQEKVLPKTKDSEFIQWTEPSVLLKFLKMMKRKQLSSYPEGFIKLIYKENVVGLKGDDKIYYHKAIKNGKNKEIDSLVSVILRYDPHEVNRSIRKSINSDDSNDDYNENYLDKYNKFLLFIENLLEALAGSNPDKKREVKLFKKTGNKGVFKENLGLIEFPPFPEDVFNRVLDTDINYLFYMGSVCKENLVEIGKKISPEETVAEIKKKISFILDMGESLIYKYLFSIRTNIKIKNEENIEYSITPVAFE